MIGNPRVLRYSAVGVTLAAAALFATAPAVMFTTSVPSHNAQLTAEQFPRFDGPSFLTAPLVANPDCTLTVPANPLTAQGLAMPYVLNSAGQTCLESNPNLAAFVQAVILDPATGALSVYNPVVSDTTTAAIPPPTPVLPPGAIVTIWTGFNGNVLKLTGPGAGGFVNFAQQAYDNSPLFFGALRLAEFRGKVTVPPLGTANDGLACPSTRDFSVVDQDQSDNVVVKYPAFGAGVVNGSDDASVNGRIDPALGCKTWQVPSLSAPGTMSTAGPLEEEQARAGQQAPIALVPGLDPFVTLNGKPNLILQDLYRLQVDQPLTFNSQDTKAYCNNLAGTGAPRLKMDAAIEAANPPPAFGALGANLALHLAARFAATWTNLTCPALTGQPSPIAVTIDPATGLATQASYLGVQYVPAATISVNTSPVTPAPVAPTTAPADPAAPAASATPDPATTVPVTTVPVAPTATTPDPAATAPVGP